MNSERRTPSLRMALAFLLLVAWMAGCASAPTTPSATGAAATTDDVPFQLNLTPIEVGLPGLHSVAHTVYREKKKDSSITSWLVIVSGRTNGRHDLVTQAKVNPEEWSFPPQKANNRIFLVNLDNLGKSRVRSARIDCTGSNPADCFPSRISRQLQATNTQSFTRKTNTQEWLYIVGGYGVTEDGKSMSTFDQVVAIELKDLIETIVTFNATELGMPVVRRGAIAVGNHPALAITGGGIIGSFVGDTMLVFGQMFNGLYTTDGSVAQQEYSQAVRRIFIDLPDKKRGEEIARIDVRYEGQCPDPAPTERQPIPDGPYHRRDFTLAKVLTPEGKPRIGVFGGVFKGGRSEGYLHPVYITPGGECVNPEDPTKDPTLPFVKEDDQSSQLLSQYESAIIPVYSAGRKEMYTTFFGGISQYYWDPQSSTLKRDPMDSNLPAAEQGLPFTNSISTLRVGGRGNGDFIHLDEKKTALTFPPAGAEPLCGGGVKAPYLGANSWFVMAPDKEKYFDDGVLSLDKILEDIRDNKIPSKPMVIGYIFGGIAATQPHPGKQTCASDKVYEVTLDPMHSTPTAKLVEPPQ